MTARRFWLVSAAWSSASSKAAVGWLRLRAGLGLALLLLSATALTGCATLYDKVSSSELAFESEPQGATVTMMNGDTCKTPCKIGVGEAKTQQVKATLDGKTRHEQVLRRVSYSFWFNFGFGIYGVIGCGIDWLTGAMWSYSVKEVGFDFTTDEPGDDEDEGDADDDQKPKATPEGIPLSEERPAVQGAGPGQAQAPELRPEELPPPPSPALTQLREAVPETYLAQQTRYYYGGMAPAQAQKVQNRLWHLLLKMQDDGEKPDIDEAVRRDRFAQLRLPPPVDRP